MPKKQQQKTTPRLTNVFGEDNMSDEDDGTDWVRKALKAEGEKNKIKKQTKLDMQRALDEDPTIYQYDEVYDDMERTKVQSNTSKCKERKPKYIENLLKTAERRKKEQEHRIERMVQKEREAEGEKYADKESFVTSAYRAKLEEFKKIEEEEARMNRLETIGDVTKQQDMSGFYRHLYEQTVDSQNWNNEARSDRTTDTDVERKERKDTTSDTNETECDKNENTTATNATDEKSKATIKSKKPRQYRQRAVETYESDSETEINKDELEKDQTVVLSVDRDADKSLETQEPEKKRAKQDSNDVETNKCADEETESKESNSKVKDSETPRDNDPVVSKNEKIVNKEKTVEKDRSSIWEKRTVGLVFEAALQRYYARKSSRLAAV